jgi:hypothetical protein
MGSGSGRRKRSGDGDAASAVGMPSAASLAVATQLVQSEFMMRQKSFKGAKFKNISEELS